MKNTTAITDVSLAHTSAVSSIGRVGAPVAISIVFSNCQLCVQIGSTNESWLVSGIGTGARRILQQSTTGSVLAVFQRSFYVQCDHGIMCIGLASLGQGPLHVLLESDHGSLCQGLSTGSKVSIGTVLKQSCDLQSVGATGEADYSGQVLPDTSWRISKQHSRLLSACDAPASTSGFGWLLNESCWQRGVGLKELSLDQLDVFDRGLRTHSYAAVTSLYGWLHDPLPSAPSLKLQTLLGAGPGLTPAGDDLLAGVMLALHRIQGGDRVEKLWQTLQPALANRTNVISAAHLHMAARGQCAEPVLALLDRFMATSLPDSAGDILALVQDSQRLAARIGSSSGWDMLAGMSLVVRALADSLCSSDVPKNPSALHCA